MTTPFWFLLLICTEEFVLMLAFLWHRQWLDVIYWLGVMFINGGLLVRAR